jgi:hypothetical protein
VAEHAVLDLTREMVDVHDHFVAALVAPVLAHVGEVQRVILRRLFPNAFELAAANAYDRHANFMGCTGR